MNMNWDDFHRYAWFPALLFGCSLLASGYGRLGFLLVIYAVLALINTFSTEP